MKLSYIIFVLLLSPLLRMYSQTLEVESMVENLSDLSASTKNRKDENGLYCALIKVVAINKELTFTGNVVGNVDNKLNEYWVYIKQGSASIKISDVTSSITVIFNDFGIQSLQSKVTYNMKLAQKAAKVDKEVSFSYYKEQAAKGDADALVQLGKCYLYGMGTSENSLYAISCFEKAAALDNVEAVYLIGNCYFYGNGIAKDYDIAFKYYSNAAKEYYAPALQSLGKCYEKGLGTRQDMKKAKKYYIMAKELQNK